MIYDNACHLHNYALNRDPVFFQNTWFLVDRFHWCNHVGKSANIAYIFFSLECFVYIDGQQLYVMKVDQETIQTSIIDCTSETIQYFFSVNIHVINVYVTRK